VKIRLVAVLPVLSLACVGLTGCDSKAGTAAVVSGHKISETQLSSYLRPDAPPVRSSDGSSSIVAKTFALQYLVQNEVFSALLAANGSPVTEADLATAKTSVLHGGDEQVLTDQITKAGFTSKFEPVVLRNHELLTLLQAKLTSNQQATAAIAKLRQGVSISPRYGSWNQQSLSLVGVGKKQLPSVLSFEGTLPGDVKLPTQQ
jgi:hypothetical protein